MGTRYRLFASGMVMRAAMTSESSVAFERPATSSIDGQHSITLSAIARVAIRPVAIRPVEAGLQVSPGARQTRRWVATRVTYLVWKPDAQPSIVRTKRVFVVAAIANRRH